LLFRTVVPAFVLLGKFDSEFPRHGFLQPFRAHPVAFGGAHKNVVSIGCGSLIGRIQQCDFDKQLAEFGFIIRADLLYQQILRGIGVLRPETRWKNL